MISLKQDEVRCYVTSNICSQLRKFNSPISSVRRHSFVSLRTSVEEAICTRTSETLTNRQRSIAN